MALFQGVNPQSLEGARMSLLQRLQAQMSAHQKSGRSMGHTMELRLGPGGAPGGGMNSGGAAVGRPLGVGMSRGSLGRTGVTQGDNVAQAIMARLGAINPRALMGEHSGSPGEGIQQIRNPGGMIQYPGQYPGGPPMAPSPGGGPTNSPGMGNADASPGGAPMAPGGTPAGYSGAFTGDQVGAISGPISSPPPGMISPQSGLGAAQPGEIGIADTPNGQFQQQQLIPLGGGRYFDPVTGAIHGGSTTGVSASRFGR